MNLTDCVAVLALIFSVVSFCLSRRERRLSVQLQYYAQLRSWADQTVDLLSEAAFLAACDPERMPPAPNDFFTKRGEMMAAVSALIDRGRWFLPNTDPDKYGQRKAEAYQGFRQEALNYLVAVHEKVRDLNYTTGDGNKDRQKSLVCLKRGFVSEIQEVLASRKTEKILELPPRRQPG